MSRNYYCRFCGRFSRQQDKLQRCSTSPTGHCVWQAEGSAFVTIQTR